jgi:hypothetical protein
VIVKKTLLVIILAVAGTLGSSIVPGKVSAKYPEIMQCEQSCEVVAGGWPFPYLIDYPGISPTNSVSISEGILGDDAIWGGALAGTFLFWTGVMASIIWIIERIKFKKAA